MKKRRVGEGWLTHVNPQPVLPGVLLLAAALLGCRAEGAEPMICLAYACSNAARLSGTLEVPEGATVIEVEYCSKDACVSGPLDIAQLHETECVDGPVGKVDGQVCATRKASRQVQLDAALLPWETPSIPPDGEKYTLEVIESDSGRVLVDEEREADYVPTESLDDCHHCWTADMKL